MELSPRLWLMPSIQKMLHENAKRVNSKRHLLERISPHQAWSCYHLVLFLASYKQLRFGTLDLFSLRFKSIMLIHIMQAGFARTRLLQDDMQRLQIIFTNANVRALLVWA